MTALVVISPATIAKPVDNQRFARHAAERVFGKQGIEDAVGNLIGQLVGMAHADRFAGEKKLISCHKRPFERWNNTDRGKIRIPT